MSRWEDIDGPVLRAIYDEELEQIGYGKPRASVSGAVVVERSGIDPNYLANSLLKLWDDGQIQAYGARGLEVNVIGGVTSDGLRSLREWPAEGELSEILPQLLRALSEREPEPEKRSVLERGADILSNVASSTISAVIKDVTGLG